MKSIGVLPILAMLIGVTFTQAAHAGTVEGVVFSGGGPRYIQARGAVVTMTHKSSGVVWTDVADRNLVLAGQRFSACYRFRNLPAGTYTINVSFRNPDTGKVERARSTGQVGRNSYELHNPTTYR